MSKKSRKYWRKRAIHFEEEWMNRCKETIEKRLAAYYKKSLSEIQKDISALYATFIRDTTIDFKTAQALIRGKEYQEWRMTLEEYVKSIGKGDKGLERELNTLAMRSRINRLDKLYGETLQELDKLGRNVTDDMRSFLSDAYKENYSRDIFDLVKVGGLSVAISKVEKIATEKILAARWSGKNFSKRIWDNTRLLSGVLRETITTGVHRGLSIPKLSQMIEDKMNAGYKNAVRLVRTEMNFVNNQAHADSMAAAEIAAYEFIATLDNRTSAPCRSRDGETFLLSEKTVGFNYPPLHPRCRSTVAPFIEEMGRGGTRIAKVGKKNIEIPAAMNYKDYEKVYVKKELSLAEWNKQNKELQLNSNNSKINNQEGDKKIEWLKFNESKRLTDTQYKDLRKFANDRKIELSGFKKSDVDVDLMKNVIITLNTLQQKFPKVADERHKLTLILSNSMDADDFAMTEGRHITLNADAYRNVEKLAEEYQKLVDEGWFVKHTDYQAIIRHEFGHIVAQIYKIDPLKIACEITGLTDEEIFDFIETNLSKYSSFFEDGSEIISEVFAGISTNNQNEFIKRYYDKVIEIVKAGENNAK